MYRKALQNPKAVLYEDGCVQIGLVADFEKLGLVRMRLFFGNKSMPVPVTNINFKPLIPAHGFRVMQSRDHLPQLAQGQQEPLDLNFQLDSFALSLPVYGLTYQQHHSSSSSSLQE